jgi:hypothetical protein
MLPSPLAKADIASHQHPTERKKIVLQVFMATKTPIGHCNTLIAATWTLFNTINTMKIYIKTCLMAPIIKRSFAPHPRDA